MPTRLFDSNVISKVQGAMVFMANVLGASTEYSIIGKALEDKVLLFSRDIATELRKTKPFDSAIVGNAQDQRQSEPKTGRRIVT